MAQLVQFNKSPYRHHALKKEQILLINQTISQQKQQQSELFSQIFEEFETQKRILIKRYIYNRIDLDERALHFAQRSTARRFAVELIVLASNWHKAIHEEVLAMILLAQKVASCVLNAALTNEPTGADKCDLKAHLSQYFNIQFLLPMASNSEAFELPDHLAHYFAQLSFLTVSQHDKSAHVKICWHGESRMIAIEDVDLTWILSRAIKTIIKIEHQS